MAPVLRTTAMAGVLALLCSAASAKTLVYCSEGSPENFNPMINTTGHHLRRQRARSTTGWSSSRPGTTEVDAGAGRELGHRAGRQDLHLPPAPRREVAVEQDTSSRPATSTPTTCCSRSSGSGRTATRTTRFPAAATTTSATWASTSCSPRSRRSIDYTVRFTLTEPQRAVPGRPGDGLRLDPVEGIRRRAAEAGQARADRPGADRHRPVRAACSTSGTPPSAIARFDGYWGPQAEARHAGVLDQQGPGGAAGQAARQRVPDHRLSEPGRPAGDQGGSRTAADGAARAEHRLSRLQQSEEAVRRQAGAPRHQHGDRQAGDPATRSIRAPASRRRT